jgi:p-aminobenzoyl-glutamate transporter AbgT
MGFTAAIIGCIGGLCAIFGILQAAEVITADMSPINVGWDFWFMLAGVLLLGSIALLVGKGPTGD